MLCSFLFCSLLCLIPASVKPIKWFPFRLRKSSHPLLQEKQSMNTVAVNYSESFLILQASERIQTNTERLEYCVVLWDDLKSLEQDINQWTSSSIAELTNSVTNLNDKDRTQVLLATFQVKITLTICVVSMMIVI